MQRDEGDLLEAWITYYTQLLGAENVTVFDNGSNGQTRAVLDQAKTTGVKVVPSEEPADFERKGELISAYIREQTSYDWMIPADVDEFAGVLGTRGFSTARSALVEELEAADRSGKSVVRVNTAIWNIPHTSRGYVEPMKKIIVKPSAGIELDLGFHLYSWGTLSDMVDPSTLHASDICYLHFHNRPFAELQERAKLKLKDRLPSFQREALKNYSGVGMHLAPYLLLSEWEYLFSLPNGHWDLRGILHPLGIRVPHSQPNPNWSGWAQFLKQVVPASIRRWRLARIRH